MTTVRLRPTFSIPTNLNPTEVISRLREDLEANKVDELSGQFTKHHAIVSIAESIRHFWSPCLHLEVRELENGNEVFGRFSPHPAIWTGFMFAYLAIAVLIFFSCILGFSQLLAAQSCWAFWLIPLWMAIALGLWIASQIGQRFSAEEMREMKTIVVELIASEHNAHSPVDEFN